MIKRRELLTLLIEAPLRAMSDPDGGPKVARLIEERCWAVKGQPCDYCLGECPHGTDALSWQNGAPKVHFEHCDGCGKCVEICTATPSALELVPACRGPWG